MGKAHVVEAVVALLKRGQQRVLHGEGGLERPTENDYC